VAISDFAAAGFETRLGGRLPQGARDDGAVLKGAVSPRAWDYRIVYDPTVFVKASRSKAVGHTFCGSTDPCGAGGADLFFANLAGLRLFRLLGAAGVAGGHVSRSCWRWGFHIKTRFSLFRELVLAIGIVVDGRRLCGGGERRNEKPELGLQPREATQRADGGGERRR